VLANDAIVELYPEYQVFMMFASQFIIAARRLYYAPYIRLLNAHRLCLHLLFCSEGVKPHGIFIFMYYSHSEKFMQ